MVVPTAPESGTPSPSPINRVLLGNIQIAEVVIVAAGKSIVDAGGLVIPDQGLEVQFRLVFVEFNPRASTTAPVGGIIVLAGLRIKFKTAQRLRFSGYNCQVKK